MFIVANIAYTKPPSPIMLRGIDLIPCINHKGSVAKNLLRNVVGKENTSCGLGLDSEAKDLGDELILCLNVVFVCSRNLPFANHIHCFVTL